MSRSSGTYTAPSNSFNPAVEGEEAEEGDWNELLDDLEAALTESVYTGGLGSSDNRLVRTDGTDTKKVQGTGITVDDSDNITGVAALTATTITVSTLAGAIDAGAATSFELPNSAAPTVNADGEIAVDTTVADFAAGVIKYYAGAEMGVIAMPVAQFGSPSNGAVPAYNATNDQFELTIPSGSGDVVAASNFGTDNVVIRSDGTSKGVQHTGVSIDDSNNITGIAALTATTVNIGNADTTLARSGAGDITVEGNAVYRAGGTDVPLADGGTGASLTDPGLDLVMAWDDSASAVKFMPLADMTAEAAPASGDYLLLYGAEGDLRKVNWSSLPGAGGGISNVVEDTSPTLGGALDGGGFNITNVSALAATTIELGHATDTTLSRTGAGAIAVEGVGVALNSISLAHTAGTVELGHATDTTLARSAAGEVTIEGTLIKKVGKETIFYPAAAMVPRTTNGAAYGTTELATNDVMLRSLDFDTTTEEGVGFWVGMPKSWNLGTVTFQPAWTAASGSGGVVFGLAAYAFSDDDAMDTAVSGQQTSTDTLITANDMHIGPESSAITIGGTPAAGDWVYFEVTREVANGSDTLAVDAKLLGIRLHYTTSASTDV